MKKEKLVYRYGAGDDAKEMITLAVSYHLFHQGWNLINCMLRCLKRCSWRRYNKRPYFIASLAYYNDKPVGVCLIEENVVAVFVKAPYRRNGIGTALIDLLIEKYNVSGKLYMGEGVAGSYEFVSTISSLTFVNKNERIES